MYDLNILRTLFQDEISAIRSTTFNKDIIIDKLEESLTLDLETNIGTLIPIQFKLVYDPESNDLRYSHVGKLKIKRKSKSNPDGIFIKVSTALSAISDQNMMINSLFEQEVEKRKNKMLEDFVQSISDEDKLILDEIQSFSLLKNWQRGEYLLNHFNDAEGFSYVLENEFIDVGLSIIDVKDELDGHGFKNQHVITINWRSKELTYHIWNTK